jgi:hypothetical protein
MLIAFFVSLDAKPDANEQTTENAERRVRARGLQSLLNSILRVPLLSASVSLWASKFSFT